MKNETPIFKELFDQFSDVQKLAYERGYIQAKLELIEYIQQELKAKRLPASKGVGMIVKHLSQYTPEQR